MTSVVKGRLENRAELAQTFGVSLITIDAWVKIGCPSVERPAGKGSPWVFNTADVARWRERHVTETALGKIERMETDEAKRRKLAAEAGLAELALGEKRAELGPVSTMVRYNDRILGTVKERMLAIPGKLSGDFEVDQIDLITGEIHEALEELNESSANAFLQDDPDEDLEEPEATAAPEPRRVGRAVPVRRAKDERRPGPVEDERSARRVRPNDGRERA